MFKWLIKLTLSGGAMAGAFTVTQPSLLNLSEEPNQVVFTEKEKTEEQEKINDIKSLEDIDIYGKAKGCTFTFVSKWKDKRVYNAVRFVEVEEKKNETVWKDRVINIAKSKMEECKENKVLTFSWKEEQFKIVDPKKQ